MGFTRVSQLTQQNVSDMFFKVDVLLERLVTKGNPETDFEYEYVLIWPDVSQRIRVWKDGMITHRPWHCDQQSKGSPTDISKVSLKQRGTVESFTLR